MTAPTDALHAGAAVALALYVATTAKTLGRTGPHRSLWLAILALSAGEAVRVSSVHHHIEVALGPGTGTLANHLGGLGAAAAVADLLHGTLLRHRRTRIFSACLGGFAVVASVVPWLVDAPRSTPPRLVGSLIYYDNTWRSAVHWAVFLTYLGGAQAYASWHCHLHARDAQAGHLRTSLRLIGSGTAVGVLYALLHGVSAALWVLHGHAPSWLDAVGDPLTLGSALVLILLGVTWTRLMNWYDVRADVRHVEAVRPLWAELVKHLPDASPFPAPLWVRAGSSAQVRWQRARLVTETYDALLRASTYLDPATRARFEHAVQEHGLTGMAADVAVDYLCTRAALQRIARGAPPISPARFPDLAAPTTAIAAALMARRAQVARRRRVRAVITHLEEAQQ